VLDASLHVVFQLHVPENGKAALKVKVLLSSVNAWDMNVLPSGPLKTTLTSTGWFAAVLLTSVCCHLSQVLDFFGLSAVNADEQIRIIKNEVISFVFIN